MMDDNAFLRLDFSAVAKNDDIDENTLSGIAAIRRGFFNPEDVGAEAKKKLSFESIVETIKKFKSDPSDDFIRFILGDSAVGTKIAKVTQKIVDLNRDVVRSAMEAFVAQEALARFGYAPKDVVRTQQEPPTTVIPPPVATEPEVEGTPTESESNTFTYAKNRLYYLVRNDILFQEVQKVAFKKGKTSFRVYYLRPNNGSLFDYKEQKDGKISLTFPAVNDLWRRSASDLAALIARKEVSSREVVEAHLARITAVNPKLNAIVKVLAEAARKGADEADRKVAAKEALGPLHGVPFTIKENIDLAGAATTWGLPAFAEAVVPLDAPVVERMRAAGAVPIGRTNVPDMALRVHTHSSLHGVTRNPWNAGRTAGGSSGGEAAALAAGMSPVGLGNDIGGSLRNPANACGIASIRPSQGRVPEAGVIPAADRPLAVQMMQASGPMARTVADVRLALNLISGAHPRDPWSLDPPAERPRDAAARRVAMVA